MKNLYYFLLALLLLPGLAQAQQEAVVAGTVQAESGLALPGATVFVKGTYVGNSTNEEGQFQLKVAFDKGPVVLSVSFVGYETQNIPLAQPDNALAVVLKPSTILNAVVVSASRVAESIGQVPVTVEKVSPRQVEQLTNPDILSGMGRFKAVDVSSSSLLTSSFSTRGFNSSRSERVLQLADYVDTQLPSLNSNFGNLLGIPVLDVESMEILHGPASALYGANAFNGVLLFNSKDPFTSPGLSVRLRGGNRDYYDGQFRYAQKIGEKIAFKISGGYLRATDFIPDNQAPTNRSIEPNNHLVGSRLGYDAVNTYGDIGNTFGAAAGALRGQTVFLPGYTERQLLAGDEDTHSLKVQPVVSVLLTSALKLTLDYKYTNSNTTFQSGTRYRFDDSGAHQGRVELKGNNFFVRAFSSRDFSGGRDPQTDGSYNLGFLGAFLANQAVPGNVINPGTGRPLTYAERYFGTYAAVYNQAFGATNDPAVASAAAFNAANVNAPLLRPGTAEFNAARDRIIHDATPGRGARVVLRSFLNDASGQYNFKTDIADIIVGGAYRQFLLGSDGTLFSDTPEERVRNYEYGAYTQLSKSLLDERLRASVAGRLDRFRNFKTAFSPRASLVYSAGAAKQHNFRASYSRAFRSPTQTDQFIRLDLGRAILLGNVEQGFQGYSLGIARAANPTDARFQVSYDKLRLEEVNTLEVGYRAQLFGKLYADLTYFRSRYNDFIGTQAFIGNINGTRPGLNELTTINARDSKVRVIQLSANVDQQVRTQGASLGLSYVLAPELTLSGNYSFNDFTTDAADLPTGFQTFFNTPRHKFNFSLDGQAFDKALSYNINYRWAESFVYESTFATGAVPVSRVVDAQAGYTVPRLKTTLQAGVSNLFDAPNFQVYGAPSIGRLGYVGLLFELK